MIIHLKMTDDEYSYIQTLLHRFMKDSLNDDTNLKWYDYKYISNALEDARKDGEIYHKKGGRGNEVDQ